MFIIHLDCIANTCTFNEFHDIADLKINICLILFLFCSVAASLKVRREPENNDYPPQFPSNQDDKVEDDKNTTNEVKILIFMIELKPKWYLLFTL